MIVIKYYYLQLLMFLVAIPIKGWLLYARGGRKRCVEKVAIPIKGWLLFEKGEINMEKIK